MKALYLFLFLFFGRFFSFSQNIVVCEEIKFSLDTTSLKNIADSNLNLIEKDSTEKDELDFKVKATIKVETPVNDTVILKTTVKSSLLGPRNLKVNIIEKDGDISHLKSWIEQQTDAQSLSDIQLLKFILPNKKNAIISVEYIVIGTMIFRYQPENPYFYSIQQQQEYFYPKDIPIKKINVYSPDSIKYFLSYKQERNSTIEDINVSFINRNHYIEKLIKGDNYMINVYIPNNFVCMIEPYIYNLQKHMYQFSSYLSHKKQSDIIFINWRDDKNRKAFGESLGSYVVCDINFKSKDLLHEIIHSFFPIKVEERTKGEYFIKESIIEWLALFLSETKIENPRQIFHHSASLYDIHANNHSSWNMIYLVGPLIIEEIALIYGKDKMANIIISFLEDNKDTFVNYDKFMDYLNKYLPQSLVMKLDAGVKFVYE